MSTLVQELAMLSSGPEFLKYFGVTNQTSELNGYEEYLLQRFYQHVQREQAFDVRNESDMFRKMRQVLMTRVTINGGSNE